MFPAVNVNVPDPLTHVVSPYHMTSQTSVAQVVYVSTQVLTYRNIDT